MALITGGTGGIGLSLAESYIEKGWRVALCGRNESKLEALRSRWNSDIFLAVRADVSKRADCKHFIEHSAEHFGKLDVLINNAGISMRALFSETQLDVLEQAMAINFWGAVNCCKFALPHILKQKGSIVGVSSIAGYKGLPCRTGYSSSKFALQGFLEALRLELFESGVNVMWVSPGFVASNIRNTALDGHGAQQKETPLDEKKLMSPEECAQKIIKAIDGRKRHLIMTSQGKLTVWLNKWWPSLADKLVYKHFLNEADSPLKKK